MDPNDEAQAYCNQLIEDNTIRKIKENEIMLYNKTDIGHGEDSIVFKGMFEGNEVAVKKLKNVNWKNLANELYILTTYENEHIPKFYGLILDKNNNVKEMVFEYIDGQTLEQMELEKIEESQKIKIAKEICDIIDSINKEGYIHRDIKPSNIMLDKNYKTYLLDFGISKVKTEDNSILTVAKGDYHFISPEVLVTDDKDNKSLISHKVDVWAFGCVLSYLFSETLPWTNVYKEDKTKILIAINSKKTFPIPKKIKNEKIREIIALATILDKKDRPEISKIKEMLDKL